MIFIGENMKLHDFTGLKCPIPVLKAKRVIKMMAKNEQQIFLSDDPASPIDFKHLCDNEKLKLNIEDNHGTFTFKIIKL